MNIAELRLECLRLAVTNENGKNPIYQVKDAQHYLDWVMSPNITIELQALAPDINVDPEYNAHLESLDTPERALRLNGWEKSQWEYWVNANYPNIQICINSVGIHVGPTDRYMDFATTWDKQKSFNRWLIEDVENKWDRTRCENYLKAEGWKVDEDHPYLQPFEKDAMATFWNGFQWGINTAVNNEMTKPHFWDGKGSFPEWLAAEITKLQNQGGDGGEAFRKAMEAKEQGIEVKQPETAAKPDQSAEIRQENAITFLKSILPCSEELTGEVNHDNDTVDFFWRGYKYRFDPSKDEISLVVKSGDAIDNNASILMTALVRQAAKRYRFTPGN